VTLLSLALAVRVALVLATPHLRLVDDPADYQRLAVSVAHGHGFGPTVLARGGGPTAFRSPLYPFLLGLLYRVVGVHVQAARLVEALAGVVVVGLLALLALRLFGRRAAMVTLAVAAVYPPLVLAGGSLLTESLSLPIELGALLAVLEYRRTGAFRWVAVTGGLAGLGVLNRENYFVLLAPLALLAWTGRPRWSARALVVPVAMVALAAAVVAPWTIRNRVKLHALVPVTDADGFILAGVYNDYSAHHAPFPATFVPPVAVPAYRSLFADPRLDEVQLSKRLQAKALGYLRQHKTYAGRVVLWNTLRLFDLDGFRYAHVVGRSLGYSDRLSDVDVVSFWLLALLAIAGAVAGASGAAIRRVPAALWLVPAVFAATTVVALGTYRYRMPIEPFVVLLAALAIVGRADRRSPARR
jgi:4-amino-4-deoxy-L-arabinose transferase-like glycosyltransferase